MKLERRVKTIEVKRCYVISQGFTSKKIRKGETGKHKLKPDGQTFLVDLKKRKQAVLKMDESDLDKIIALEYRKRLQAFGQAEWYLGNFQVGEAGVWKGAGGLPIAWTRKSLQDSADRISKERKKKNSRYALVRAMKTIPEIIAFKKDIQREKYLLPIVLSGGTIASCRKGLRKMRLDIDDGCMRSLAYAVSGDEEIRAYIGIIRK